MLMGCKGNFHDSLNIEFESRACDGEMINIQTNRDKRLSFPAAPKSDAQSPLLSLPLTPPNTKIKIKRKKKEGKRKKKKEFGGKHIRRGKKTTRKRTPIVSTHIHKQRDALLWIDSNTHAPIHTRPENTLTILLHVLLPRQTRILARETSWVAQGQGQGHHQRWVRDGRGRRRVELLRASGHTRVRILGGDQAGVQAARPKVPPGRLAARSGR